MKILLSAIETNVEHAIAANVAKAPHVLTSFYGCRQKARLESKIYAHWASCLRQAKLRFADSGAFTFRIAKEGNAQAASGVLGANFDVYALEYVAWLQHLVKLRLVDVWVELDIGIVMGSSWVDKHRRHMIDSGLGSGLIQVWHAEEHDWDYWLYLIDESLRPGRSRYVAIEGNNSDRPSHPYSKFIRAAYDRGVKVHGFKMTGSEALNRHPFYSTDSTTWISPVRYGTHFERDLSGKMTATRGASQGRRRTRQPASHRPGSRERIDILVSSARSWIQTEQQLTDMWRVRGVDWDLVTDLEADSVSSAG